MNRIASIMPSPMMRQSIQRRWTVPSVSTRQTDSLHFGHSHHEECSHTHTHGPDCNHAHPKAKQNWFSRFYTGFVDDMKKFYNMLSSWIKKLFSSKCK